jgi:Tfp pilus assembly protein PilN
MTEQAVEETQKTEAPAGPIRVSWAGIPKVNLLPLAILEGRRFRKTQGVLGGVVLGAVLVAGAAVLWAQGQVSSAQDDLDKANAQVTSLQAEQRKYDAVPALVSQVEAATQARSQVMATDVLWYRLMNDVAGAIPSGVTADTVTMTVTEAAGAAPTTGQAQPLTQTGLGAITMSGKSPSYNTVADWMEDLDKLTGVGDTALGNATASGGQGITYALSSVLTDDALSHRYDETKEGS